MQRDLLQAVRLEARLGLAGRLALDGEISADELVPGRRAVDQGHQAVDQLRGGGMHGFLAGRPGVQKRRRLRRIEQDRLRRLRPCRSLGQGRGVSGSCPQDRALRPCVKARAQAHLEIALGGVLALRAPGRRLEWDSPALKVKGAPELDALIRTEYRNGWTL